MNKAFRLLFVIMLLLLPYIVLSQHHHDGNEVEHLNFWDTLFGSEEEYQVCYPKDHQSFFYAIFALSLISLGMAVSIFYGFRRYNRKLKKISALIQEKNTEMLDSIRYAQRIQNTILPTSAEFNSILPKGFVIYQPKDIVSGDFYWVHEVGHKKIIAVIDCTGHGVPGAFLSLIGSNALVRAVKEEKELSPSLIFDRMNDDVKESLNQLKASDVMDGMEGAIVVYDMQRHIIEFSGARMNLIHVSNGQLELIRGSKLTVGTVEEHVQGPPESIERAISKGDSIYMYSDGVVDQFGANDRGKFKISRLKELLLEVGAMEIEQQEQVIRTTLDQWRGNEEQIDDLTMIGVRF